LDYPFHDWTAVVTWCGRICYPRRKINRSQVLAGQKVGFEQTAEHVGLVSFMEYDLWYFYDETCGLEPIEDPFGPRLSPHVSGIDPVCIGRGDWIRTSDPLRPRRKNPHNWGQRETAAPRFP